MGEVINKVAFELQNKRDDLFRWSRVVFCQYRIGVRESIKIIQLAIPSNLSRIDHFM